MVVAAAGGRGREELLDIEAALKRDQGRVPITALHGLRGVGKTTLAAAYADRHGGALPANCSEK
jgi:predicted AAA+ superfamily ATPase